MHEIVLKTTPSLFLRTLLRTVTPFLFFSLGKKWRKRSIPTHSEWLYPLTFDAGKGLKEA